MYRIIKNTKRCRRSGHQRAAINQRACCRIETRPGYRNRAQKNYLFINTAKQKKKLSPAQKAAKKKRRKEYMTICNHSQDYNARFTATHRTVSVYRVLQMARRRVTQTYSLYFKCPTTKQSGAL